MHIQLTKNFSIAEFIPEDILKRLGKEAIYLVDDRLILTLQQLRKNLKAPIHVNTWHKRGRLTKRYSFRGYLPQEYTKGEKYNQMKYGRGAEFTVDGITPEDVQEHIKNNIKKYPLLTALKVNTPGYTYIDCRTASQPTELLILQHKNTKVTRVNNKNEQLQTA